MWRAPTFKSLNAVNITKQNSVEERRFYMGNLTFTNAEFSVSDLTFYCCSIDGSLYNCKFTDCKFPNLIHINIGEPHCAVFINCEMPKLVREVSDEEAESRRASSDEEFELVPNNKLDQTVIPLADAQPSQETIEYLSDPEEKETTSCNYSRMLLILKQFTVTKYQNFKTWILTLISKIKLA